MKKLKVAHIITRMDWGGSPDIVRIICAGLDAKHCDVTLISGPSAHLTQRTETFLGSFVNNLKIIKSLKRNINLFYDISAFWSMWVLFKKENFDIVHTHTAKAGAVGRMAAFFAGVKIIVHTSHGHNFYGYFNPIMSRFIIWAERFLSFFTTRIITLTQLEKRDLLKFKICCDDKIITAQTAIEIEKLKRLTEDKSLLLKKELQIEPECIVIGTVARLEQIKGVDNFIDATIELTKTIPDVKVIIVGEGSLKQHLEQKIDNVNMSDKFIFTGWQEDVSRYMSLMDIMVLASLNEAVGLVLIEAQSLGIPVVATKVGGIPEVVEDGKSGLLVPAEEPAAMMAAIKRLTGNKEMRHAMGIYAKDLVSKKYSVTNLLNTITQTYNTLIKRQ